MTTRLAATVVGVSVVALLVATAVGIGTGRSLNRDLDRQQLRALQASAATDLAVHLRFLQTNTTALSRSPETASALDSFDTGHRELLTGELPSRLPLDDLVAEYRRRYIEPLRPVWPDIQGRDVVPENPAGVYLQTHYSLPGDPLVDPQAVNDAGDGSSWSAAHALLHPGYRDIVDRLGVLDLYLVEPDAGHVVYSVGKRPDLGTSLQVGPFSGSGLALAVEQARRAADGEAIVTDLGRYPPAVTTAVGFVASPIRSGQTLLGFVVVMYDAAPLDALLTAERDWEAGGYPPTAETLLFGDDGMVRTEPRSYVEDPVEHLDASARNGMSDRDRDLVETLGTTVLVQSVPASTLSAARSGNTELSERSNLLGEDVLSVVAPIDVGDFDWYVLAEIQVAAADERVDDFAQQLIVGVAAIVVGLAFGAVAWARRLVRPVRELSERLGRSVSGPLEVEVPPSSPVEFRNLARSFESMAERIDEQRRLVAQTRRERLDLLRRMLPPAVAARVGSGEVQLVDEIPQASVAVLVVLGLGDFARNEDRPDVSKDILNRVLSELDDLAARHQLDRIKVVGDAYFASCGHDRPFIDHAPRTLAFAVDARDAIRDVFGRPPSPLDLVVGIHSGPVTAGMTGGSTSVYDVWGPTVTTAHLLARSGGPGEIMVSAATKALLPDRIELVPVAGPGEGQMWSVDVESARGRA